MVPVHVADCKTSLVKQKKSKKEKHTLDLRLETCGVVLRFFYLHDISPSPNCV